MPEFLPYFLVPVAALLFLNLRLSRKLRYPHDLLQEEQRRGAASFLFRSFRTYYDTLLDGAIAVSVAFALAPPSWPRRSAVVIDGSRSMLAGTMSGRPLDKALVRLASDPGLKGAEPFLLTFDPASGSTRLAPIGPLLKGIRGEAAARRLQETFDFFAVDYGHLEELRRRGYGDVTLLTDRPRVKPEGFRILASGGAAEFAVYPAGVRSDPASGTWLVSLVESGPRVPVRVLTWSASLKLFVPLARDRYAIEEGMAGRRVRFPAGGLYMLSFKGPYGQQDIDLPLRLEPRPSTVAVGPFSERMLSVFSDAGRNAPPVLALVDLGRRAPAGARTVITARVPGDGAYLLDPSLTGGGLVAIARLPGVDMALGPSSLANEDLVLAYDRLLDRRSPPFTTVPPGGALTPAGTAFLASTGPPLLPPPSQFFATRSGGPRLALPQPSIPRWPWVLLLACLSALKLAAWSRLSGRSLLFRD